MHRWRLEGNDEIEHEIISMIFNIFSMLSLTWAQFFLYSSFYFHLFLCASVQFSLFLCTFYVIKYCFRQRFSTLVWFIHRLIEEQLGVGVVLICFSFFSLLNTFCCNGFAALYHDTTYNRIILIIISFYKCPSIRWVLVTKQRNKKQK